MKRILSVIITVLLLSSCLFMTVSADGTDITFSDDYKKIYYKGYTYSRFDDDYVDYYETRNVDVLVELTKEQLEEIEVSVEANDENTIFYAYFEFLSDGSTMEASFMRDDCLAELNTILKGKADTYIIDVGYYDYNSYYIEVENNALFGEESRINGDQITDYYFGIPVTSKTSDRSIDVITGEIFYCDEDFYYVDFAESGIEDPSSFDAGEADFMVCHLITDMDLSLELEDAYNDYYSEEFGFMEDDDFTGSVSNIFLVFIFAVIPFAVFVTFLVLTLRAKGIYKRFFAIISALAASELFVFAAIYVYLMISK